MACLQCCIILTNSCCNQLADGGGTLESFRAPLPPPHRFEAGQDKALHNITLLGMHFEDLQLYGCTHRLRCQRKTVHRETHCTEKHCRDGDWLSACLMSGNATCRNCN